MAGALASCRPEGGRGLPSVPWAAHAGFSDMATYFSSQERGNVLGARGLIAFPLTCGPAPTPGEGMTQGVDTGRRGSTGDPVWPGHDDVRRPEGGPGRQGSRARRGEAGAALAAGRRASSGDHGFQQRRGHGSICFKKTSASLRPKGSSEGSSLERALTSAASGGTGAGQLGDRRARGTGALSGF